VSKHEPVTIAVALLLMAAPPAVATVSGVNGDLAYETAVRPGIAVVDAAGDLRTPPALARLGGSPRDPAWSPDGTRLAFTATRAGNQDIYVIARDGTGERRLTVDPAPDSGAAWSPDGGSIAFESTRDGDTDIYVMNADGTVVRHLTSTPGVDEHPAWSPDGRRIAFESARDGNLELYVMAADGSAQTRVTSDPQPDHDPSWSPDGHELAFVSDTPPHTELLVISPDNGIMRQLTGGIAKDESPVWSPDGRLIAFSSNRRGAFSLYVLDANKTLDAYPRALRALGRNPDWAQLPPATTAPTYGRTANATPIGNVRVKPPGATAFALLGTPRQIPLGTRIDTHAGKVKLTTMDPNGRITTTIASKGIFTVTQARTSTVLTMPTPRCPSARASTADHLPPPDRSVLTTKVHGRVRVHGRHTDASSSGTTWTTTITCSRTTVKVADGTVVVRNRITRQTGRPVRIKARHGSFKVKGRYSTGAAFG
jgi:WD40 repeat protein